MFDFTTQVDFETMEPRERLLWLRDFLRSGAVPAWDYGKWCGTACCAAGWYEKLTGRVVTAGFDILDEEGEFAGLDKPVGPLADEFGLEYRTAKRIFVLAGHPETPPWEVTPDLVADEIDEALDIEVEGVFAGVSLRVPSHCKRPVRGSQPPRPAEVAGCRGEYRTVGEVSGTYPRCAGCLKRC